jgi:hypothetical protein
VVIFITLLAGFVPLLQVTFFALLEGYLSGLTRCERSGQNSKDHRRDPYHCGYGFQKRRKSTLCGHGLEIKRERLNSPKLYHGRKSLQNYVTAENVDAPTKTRQDTLNGCGNRARQKIDQKECHDRAVVPRRGTVLEKVL